MKKNTPDFASMKNAELVSQYNEMVLTAIDLGIKSHATVNRFADHSSAVKRCEKVHSDITAALASANAPTEDGKPAAGSPGPKLLEQILDPRNANPPVIAGETTAVGAASPGEVETADPTNTEENEDMAKRRKAAAATNGRKGKGGARPRSTNGQTIREMTEEYNAIVAKMTKAQKEAAPFARHHKSYFETLDAGKKQLKRLQGAIAKA